ncbi:hypothetical protein HNP38_002498 [Chryseobacterium defluvii]|uniref:Uncharacterized protein n=1 Tax=Chryseobacterium defluvii TaxID=160396 RepID=A0A840KHN5_9FLAO|nr:transposase [Chryseobacterium defluvii]MBB4807194.1 hypothetical protein [Chryseobacterium defluvii]
MNLKEINIGNLIYTKVEETNMSIERICKFLGLDENKLNEIYSERSIDTELLLKWGKLLEYDFFRLYSQHLILYSPPKAVNNKNQEKKSMLPRFRKSLYTKEMIEFILELLETENKSVAQVVEEYKIPKTTLYKWINKYKKTHEKDNSARL